MIWAIAVILGSVLAGTILALVPRGRDVWMGPTRTFALMAALSVVVLHLLPEALSQAGAWAILVFILGLLMPELLAKLGVFIWQAGHGQNRPHENSRRDLALEASYFGLLLHRVGDGLGLGAFTLDLSQSSARSGVIAALSAHAVPVVAIVVLTFDSVRGRGSALRRAAGLAAASIVGVFMAHSVPAETFAEASAWVSALVGGMLVHVVTHDLGLQLPSSAGARVWDVIAAGLGVYVSFLGRGAHSGTATHDHDSIWHFERALADFAIETGPLLILGLGVGAILATLGTRLPTRFLRSRGAVLDAASGTIIGAPLPLCSCSVLPISAALKARGAAPALVVAFLLSTPELGVETFALSVRFLGWEFAWIRLFGGLLLAFVAALVIASVVKRDSPKEGVLPPPIATSPLEGPWHTRALAAFDELFHHVGAWMILGLVGAALLQVALPDKAFDEVHGWFAQFAIISLVAIPSYVCAPSATPLAAVLLAKGLSPGAVFVGLLLGPATNVATIIFLRRWFGTKAAALGVLSVVVLSWSLGFMIDAFWSGPPVARAAHHAHGHGVVWQGLALVSGLLLLRAVYRSGVRGFLSTFQGDHGHAHGQAEPGSAEHSNGHGHGHFHNHGHGHSSSDELGPQHGEGR